ncbi:hypothetical protein ACTXT7_016188 [Hymenolepis weldensis]
MIRQSVSIIKDISASLSSLSTSISADYLNGTRPPETPNECCNVHPSPDLELSPAYSPIPPLSPLFDRSKTIGQTQLLFL